MKATGIVRRIDDLGRVVIPKEIRRTMKIREGAPLEIFTDAGGSVIFRKYSQVGEESGISAADLSAAQAVLAAQPQALLLYDGQYPIRYTAIDGLVPADQVIALETAVVGSGKSSDWLDAMERNMEKLQTLTGGDTP